MEIGITKRGRKHIPWFKIDNQTFQLESWTNKKDAQTYLNMFCIAIVNLQPNVKIKTNV